MDEYLKAMENYSPNKKGTEKMVNETAIIDISDTPQITAVKEEPLINNIQYMPPKTIEVRRYSLKK